MNSSNLLAIISLISTGFLFSGSEGQTINLSVTGTSLTSEGNTIVSNYNLSSSTVTLSGAGKGTVGVGGALTLTNNIVPGIYNGTVSVTASY